MELNVTAPFLLFQDEVTQICKPLFDNSAIDYFEMQQYYTDGKFISLTNMPLLTKVYLEEEIYCTNHELNLSTDRNESIIAILSKDIYVRASYQELKAIHNISLGDKLGVFHRIYIVQKKDTHFNLFGFGCCQNNPKIVSAILSNLDVLTNFGNYFVEKSKSLVSTSSKNPIYLPRFNNVLTITDNDDLIERNKIVDALAINYEINDHQTNLINTIVPQLKFESSKQLPKNILYNLSQRESECLNLIIKGYTAKESAKILQLSSRTVEEYIIRIKNKLGCFTRKELIKLYTKSI